MTRTMYDSATAGLIPAGVGMVAGYLNGKYANMDVMAARFPHAKRIGINVFASYDGGVVLDVEPGDAEPPEAPGWVMRRRAAGIDPTVYCDSSRWPSVRAAFHSAGVAEPHYWIALYDGDPTIMAGAVAKQHTHMSDNSYDISSVAGYWPGIDSVPTLPHLLEDDMAMVQLKPGFGADVNGNLLSNGRDQVTMAFTNGPQSAGIGVVYGYAYCDFGKAKLRVAFHGPKGWRVEYVTVDSADGAAQPIHPQQFESHCSIVRMPLDPNDNDSSDVPVGFGTNVFPT